MTNFFNQKTVYSVENSKEGIVLTGKLTTDGSYINEFNGTFVGASGEYLGTFFYNEADLTCIKSISDMSPEKMAKASIMVDEAIQDFKNKD